MEQSFGGSAGLHQLPRSLNCHHHWRKPSKSLLGEIEECTHDQKFEKF
jgi:hypothetical protein